MSVMTLEKADRHIGHVWSEPRSVAEGEAPGPLAMLMDETEPIDFAWWEPRPDAPWRRQVARDREAFGGEYVAGPSAPVEGPNNPNRLRRELEWAEREATSAGYAVSAASEDLADAEARIEQIKERLA